MLDEILGYLNNYFVPDNGYYIGDYSIQNGSISLPFISDGQYFKIVGSKFNDGVYQKPIGGLIDEDFHGGIWAMCVPPGVITLTEEIEQWQKKYGEVAESPYSSESFGGYSYSKLGGSRIEASASDWVRTFKSRLNQWRKI